MIQYEPMCPRCYNGKSICKCAHPSCSELGLEVVVARRWHMMQAESENKYVRADEAEKIATELLSLRREIAEGKIMYGWQNNGVGAIKWSDSHYPPDTHTALLLRIKPIVRDSFEQFVKDMAGHAKFQFKDCDHWAMNSEYWVERARALLSTRDGGGDET